MESCLLNKDDLKNFVDSLLAESEVIAPVRLEEGQVSFSPVTSFEEIDLSGVNDPLPPKRFFLPQRERLFRFDAEGRIQEEADEKKRVIFGIRSCDVTALNFLENFFRKDFPDSYFLKKKENTVLISLVCLFPGEHCFCVCADSGPALKEGYDLQFTDLGEKYLVEIGSEKGKGLGGSQAALFSKAGEADLKEKEERLKNVKYTNRYGDDFAYLERSIARLTSDKVPESVWKKLEAGCLACGGCAYVCPTCSCFTVQDFAEEGGGGSRERLWDSCVYSGFTREASGHNPRGSASERRKRRFYHKLNYYYMRENAGKSGCVCCGRCVAVCPGTDNAMPEVVRSLRRGE